MSKGQVRAEVEMQGQRLVGKLGSHTFEDPDQMLRAADSLRDRAHAWATHRASVIAEDRALVGSSSHHMDRGAASHMHYDRRASQVIGPPAQQEVDFPPLPEEPEFAPGDSPATGTGPESVAAQERISSSQKVMGEIQGEGPSGLSAGGAPDREEADGQKTAVAKARGTSSDAKATPRGAERPDAPGNKQATSK